MSYNFALLLAILGFLQTSLYELFFLIFYLQTKLVGFCLFVLLLFLFFKAGSFCSPGCSGTHEVAQVGLKLSMSSASVAPHPTQR
jgi:hypothetical protein